ncbi:hypothetical protein CN507_29810 [Bacillus cereus]|uniref:Uncharacterized protein n=1 Tax=Bacillus mycoides TaxID=1405 RepID=A0A1S9SW04_BACMY|nr:MULTISPECIES: hypothetical protein [Bacillus cereus group]EJS10665.1 hypothetical protein IKO_00455 [Bacillus cereus VDM034]EJS12273.1 hypothetical protein IKS_04735 [Bacillus cereus VDM062]EOP58406.1 hypothetical protein IKQ_00516 [Bacillus cereus VDM053]PES61025.1 hypothetical protein CN507_29810 [Bacillus cereus]MBG9685567.1 hypothetical protein [Bacillus mycoides]
MRNKNMERMTSYTVLCLIGAVLLYFEGGIELSLQYVIGFIIFSAIFGLIGRLFFKKKNESGAYPLPETDERIESLTFRIVSQIFALSLFIAFVVLFVLYFMNREAVIRVDYVLGYVFLVFFVGLTFGPRIAKKRDQ